MCVSYLQIETFSLVFPHVDCTRGEGSKMLRKAGGLRDVKEGGTKQRVSHRSGQAGAQSREPHTL